MSAPTPLKSFKAEYWMNAPEFKLLTLEARALWFEMLKVMGLSIPYGHLKLGERYLGAPELASLVGVSVDKSSVLLQEILDADLCQMDQAGRIKSELLISKEEIRQRRAAGGKKGGNPALRQSREGGKASSIEAAGAVA